VYNGVQFAPKPSDQRLAELRAELGLNKGDFVIGHVANFRTPKGHLHLIDAAAKVCRETPKARFLLIGEAKKGMDIRRQVETRIAEHNLSGNVSLLGFREDVPELLYVMDMFVLSSISEGLPLSVVEAQAAGLPVVATDVGGLAEIVTDGESGYLVGPGDPDALAAKILALARDRDLCTRMGRAGRESAEQKFSLATMITNYQNLYTELTS